jgi:predicted esterase
MDEHHLTVSRSARYYTLGSAAAGEVWFVLHGYGQLAARFLQKFALLDNGRRRLVAPEALSRFYLDGSNKKIGAAWMTREDRLAEIDDTVRYLDALYAEVVPGISGKRIVHVLGFSQGAAAACRWAALGSSPIDRVILWGGEVPPDLDASLLKKLPLVFVHGRQDEMITPKVAAAHERRLAEHGISYRMVAFDGGHELNEAILRDIATG